jgi:hypothetical protein
MHQFLMSTLISRIHSLLARAQHVLKGPFQIWNFYAFDAFAQDTHQLRMRMLSKRISS